MKKAYDHLLIIISFVALALLAVTVMKIYVMEKDIQVTLLLACYLILAMDQTVMIGKEVIYLFRNKEPNCLWLIIKRRDVGGEKKN